ncbi:MAG TPA: DNA cytosine methyltransferase [Verrucomicrobiae bacterium]|nr:DNA cytosine methyltransferase [Verrucomicrobiae bacterium]
MKPLNIVDLFCGAGGTSTGILKAADRLGRPVALTAVNHWPTAINTHTLNHPRVKHLCESVENLHPLDLAPAGLDLLAASCECRYHSNARGGGPCNEQSRAQAWQLVRWATDVRVNNILMENVREFLNWGPLLTRSIVYKGRRYRKGRPDPRKRGQTFTAWVNALTQLGYLVEWRLQNAADYGDATARIRLILQARLNRPVAWPDPTHGPGRPLPWHPAADHIDLSIIGKSLFGKDGKPRLCRNTVERIIAGLEKFGGSNARAFIVMLKGTSRGHLRSSAKSIDAPLPTVQAAGQHLMLCQPFIYHITHRGRHASRCHSLQKPLPTITTAHRGEMALVQPLVLKYYRTGRCKPLDLPLDSVTTKARFRLIQCGNTTLGLDIFTRMLLPAELAACHSFPPQYEFTGNLADKICQIGNSVPVELAAAHAAAILS